VSHPSEDQSLQLLKPVPEEKLHDWLKEFYGKSVHITKREILRHRDLSYVERLFIADGLPKSLIYKLVLPPWDVEQDLHERLLIPSISNSAQLYLSGRHGAITALFLEDLGTISLLTSGTTEIAGKLGEEMAKMHRAYSYRMDELTQTGILHTLFPIDYVEFVNKLSQQIRQWHLIEDQQINRLQVLAQVITSKFAGEPISLVHGDFYAENILIRNSKLFIIDWSWFTILGVPIMDLATLTMKHIKNGDFIKFREDVIEHYCYESGRKMVDVKDLLPPAEKLSRILFLGWLVERRHRGIMGTTVGPVDDLIPKVIQEITDRKV
jgi:hypothetical protein